MIKDKNAEKLPALPCQGESLMRGALAYANHLIIFLSGEEIHL
jgi:hypothetical protein